MKDIIWTLIVVWLIYKVVELFKTATVKRSYVNTQNRQQPPEESPERNPGHHGRDIKDAVRRHINKTGEYVDFEEIK